MTTSSAINYYSEFRDFNLVFLNTYHKETCSTFKHVKRTNFLVESKVEYWKIKAIVDEFCETHGINSRYSSTVRGIDYTNYESDEEEGYEKVSHDVDYLNYIYLFFDNDIGISISYTNNGDHALDLAVVHDLFEYEAKAQEFFDELYEKLTTYKHNRASIGRVNFICQGHNGLYLKELKLKNATDFDLNAHYNDDFKEISEKIQKALEKDVGKGIILLHGKHGTGKTSYLRYLIQNLKKSIIYVSPDMSHRVSEPSFLSFLLKHKNAVLIIEDAENVIKTREAGENQAVSNLLNITDGILGDGLNFQVICTFNTGFDHIDPALKRKGRMIAQYEFQNLSEDKTIELVHKLYGDHVTPIHAEMSLAEIFNMEDDNFDVAKKSRPMGFTAKF